LNSPNSLLSIELLIQTIYCWSCFYRAQFLEYDANYALIIQGFIISFAAFWVLILMVFKKIEWIKRSKIAIIIWVFIGSPITCVVVAIFYGFIFGSLAL
jgi:glucan phosphoethanolaminetransferase (alkaline phosphatase superfamily)